MAGKFKQGDRRRRLFTRGRPWPWPSTISALFSLCLFISTVYFHHKISFLDGTVDNKGAEIFPGRVTNNGVENSAVRQEPLPKEPILRMLAEAEIDLHTLNVSSIPTWKEFQDWYGAGDPVIVGLDTCETYQAQIPLERRIVAPAGLFHSGTNVLASLLHSNCYFGDENRGGEPEDPTKHRSKAGGIVAWAVPWGKHSVASMRDDYTTSDTNRPWGSEYVQTLPIVVIRNPYLWMERMCVQPYAAKFHHNAELHCPNLVPTQEDYEHVFSFREPHVPVRIKFEKGKEARVWDSLVHLWSDWYQQYLSETSYPRLIVRLEDLTFRPKATLQKICTCAGGTFEGGPHQFYYVKGSAKWGPGHANQYTSWVGTMEQYKEHHRSIGHQRHGMTTEDFGYAREHLDEQLMELFRYQHPSLVAS